jgi:hypothetical protein
MVVAGACTLPVLVHASLWVRDRSDLRQLWYAMMGAGAFGYVACTYRLVPLNRSRRVTAVLYRMPS